MNELPELRLKIGFEIGQIEKEIKIINLLKNTMEKGGLDEIQLRAAASTLHSIYNGIEKVLLLKFKSINIEIEFTQRWHTDLLIQSSEKGLISGKLE